MLVNEGDAARVERELSAALASPDALVRATAARVAGVRDITALAPALREVLARETDYSAAREQIRAVILLGNEADVDLAIAAAAKFPAYADAVVADAVGRRGGAFAINTYMAKLRKLRDLTSMGNFFERAIWGYPGLVEPTSTRLLVLNDAPGFAALLDALLEAGWALPPAEAVKALASRSEEIRTETAWFLARGYAPDGSQIKEPLRAALLAERGEPASDREGFARELLRRIAGEKPDEDPRWVRWIGTSEGDAWLVKAEPALFTYFTNDEYEQRESRCKVQPVSCEMPKRRERTIPSQPVRQPDFALPGTLPPGLASQLFRRTGCAWIGVGGATVDRMGRVKTTDLKDVSGTCLDLLTAILRLSYATNNSLASAMSTDAIVMARARRSDPCLDESLDPSSVRRVGGNVAVPVITKRVEPLFPESVRREMPKNSHVLVVVEAVITREGCVRSINIQRQSPYPALNGAAVTAISQWKFEPGRLDGKPVDTIFNLTVNFRLGL